MENRDLKYLRSLSKLYPNTASAATEIINLSAILSLPKGTEHFMTVYAHIAEWFRGNSS